MGVASATWLCPHDADRARVLDNSRHLSRARTVASATIGLCLIYAVPEYGWWMLPMFALSVLNNVTLDTRMRRSRKPEYHVAVSLVGSQMPLPLAAALTGGPSSLLLPLVAVPTAFFAARFRAQVAWLGMGVGILALFGATFGAHAAQTVEH